MIGTIKSNLILGLIGMALTFFFSIHHNLWLTAFIRSCYSFMILFLAGFMIRWILGTLVGIKDMNWTAETESEQNTIGNHVDVSTPEENDSLIDSLKSNLKSSSETNSFSPLEPSKFVSKKNTSPEELAKAVRHMSEE